MELPSKFNTADWNNFLQQAAINKGLTRSETRVFLTRFDYENWLERIEDIWQSSDVNSFESFNRHSSNIYRKFRAECPDLGMGAGNFIILRDYLLEQFQPSDSDGDRFVAISESTECYQAVLQPGSLIRIKAPSKMGKTTLLNKIIDYAAEQEYQTIKINLLQIESDRFSSLDRFLRWFCVHINDALKLELNLERYWSQDRGCVQSCTRYLEQVLEDLPQPLVLGLDEVDRLLNYPDLSQDFFYLLRSWHEEANNDELWEKLRLIVVYSTEDFGNLDINQSPFNVGIPIQLKSFDRQQIQELAEKYRIDITNQEIKKLLAMLGGHPYLIDLAISYLAKTPQLDVDQLLQQSVADTGIFSSYLRQHLVSLSSNPDLTQVFLEVLNSPKAIRIDTLLAYQLYRMGLIRWSKEVSAVKPSCELYRLYFLPRLNNRQLTTNN